MQLDPERCRSLLFVPAGNERFLTSALRGDADVIQIDLEDAIAPNQKDCLLYTSPSPRDYAASRMPSSA